jgi:ABC-type phosphate transport system substrate-binding protein
VRIVGCALLALTSAVGSARAEQSLEAFKVIVNPGVAGGMVNRGVLAEIYLGKAQRWGDGTRIVPVDLSATSAVREAFSTAVLGMPVDAVKVHWLRTIHSGKLPPRIKPSDQDVIAAVAAEPGGVGYVSSDAIVPETVHVVAVQ